MTSLGTDQPLNPLPLRHRIVGIVTAPALTMTRVIAAPRALDVLVVTFAIAAMCGAAFLSTEVGRVALVDQWVRTAEAFTGAVDDVRYREFEALSEHGAAVSLIGTLISGPVAAIAISALVFVFFRGPARAVTFAQVFAVVAHAGVILAVQQVVVTPLNYARETLSSPTRLGNFFPMLDETSPAARFLGALDVFAIWWLVVLATGVALLYNRRRRAVAAAFLAIYVGLAASLAAVMAIFGGTA